MEILLKLGGFDVDGGVEMVVIQSHVDVQKGDLGVAGKSRNIMFKKEDRSVNLSYKNVFLVFSPL